MLPIVNRVCSILWSLLTDPIGSISKAYRVAMDIFFQRSPQASSTGLGSRAPTPSTGPTTTASLAQSVIKEENPFLEKAKKLILDGITRVEFDDWLEENSASIDPTLARSIFGLCIRNNKPDLAEGVLLKNPGCTNDGRGSSFIRTLLMSVALSFKLKDRETIEFLAFKQEEIVLAKGDLKFLYNQAKIKKDLILFDIVEKALEKNPDIALRDSMKANERQKMKESMASISMDTLTPEEQEILTKVRSTV